MVLDPTTSIGKLRLRCADYTDLPLMPDSVYQSVLDDNDGNIPRSARIMAQYILGTLTSRTHRRLAQLEVYGNQYFEQYVSFLKLTVLNPNMMDLSPIPYFGGENETHPLVQFQQDWNKNFYSGTQSQQLAFNADNSPNDGSRLGNLNMNGWTVL